VINAVKHAAASQVCIRLSLDDGMLVLSVMDDGVGMVPQRKNSGMGLHIMEYRSRTIGGKLQVNSRKGAGTTVTVTVPFNGHHPLS
jgi:signal transduction histidine kinase